MGRCGLDNFVVDGLVSLEEWTECMKFEEDQRHEPPCHKHKHSLDPHLIGNIQLYVRMFF